MPVDRPFERGAAPPIQSPRRTLLTILDLLQERAEALPDADAILADGRAPLSYRRLRDHVRRVVADLCARGIQPRDRVAIVLPNGPEMATAFLSVAACATSAPLNPAYGAKEFEFYLADLGVRALLVEQGSDSPAVGVAVRLGIPTIALRHDAANPAGIFDLVDGPASGADGRGDRPQAAGHGPQRTASAPLPRAVVDDDTALVLHTSGTTARPKLVPLTHANLTISAANVATSLALSPDDRCLNVMPLFHIHGLVAAVLASLHAGGSVVCTAGFQAPRFFEWLDAHRPTWYTAVPTMHQGVLAQAETRPRGAAPHGLRFVRSSSSALAPQVMAALERLFEAPVIEAYGMTEAAHQMASNPLPPRVRKPGTVGVAAGPEVAIMDDRGNLLPAGQTGEVVIRGTNVTRGYEANPEANATAFTNGWFRTGDQGVIDADGYLALTGRLKEIINRGGEKISPREVDEVLLDHPAVGQVVTFAVPDPRLGEDVAAAIVLRDGRSATAANIQTFASSRLAWFKVPRVVVFVPQIPKGPTGKLQRVGLARVLGLPAVAASPQADRPPYEAPANVVERRLAEIWAEVLRVDPVGRHDGFLLLGGDSILVAQVASRIRDRLGVEMTVAALFNAATLREQAVLVEEMLLADASLDDKGPGDGAR